MVDVGPKARESRTGTTGEDRNWEWEAARLNLERTESPR